MNKLKILSAFAFALAFAGTSFAADEEIIGKYGAITIKKVMVERQVNGQNKKVEWKVAYIDDSSDETPEIKEDVKVDSVYYSRKFKAGVPSTLMLPFEVPTWKTGLSVFEYVEVVKDCDKCDYRINVRTNYTQKVKANTPYVVISEGKDHSVSFNMENESPDYITLNTSNKAKGTSFVKDDYEWNIIGTYNRIEFKNPKGIYGFAAKNKNNTKMGDFKKAVCSDTSCAYIRPFRSYLKCTLAKKASGIKALAKAGDETASLDNLPETVEVRVVEGDSTMSLGKLNTYTGEFAVDDRWYDMKGRKLLHKPTAKGTYYNNRKKVVIK